MAAPTRRYWADAITRIAPPWLGRSIGGRVLRAIGAVVDSIVDRTTDGVAARFPTDGAGDDALALIGAERRIRRGPVEDAQTYARRLRLWLDAHRIRGSHYAMLPQLQAYLAGSIAASIEAVDYSGKRVTIALDGTMTRDAIAWNADGSGHLARIWVFVHAAPWAVGGAIVTDDGDAILTDGGDTLAFDTAADISNLAELVHEWLAAHVELATIVLFDGVYRLWSGYPAPTPTWATADPSATWGDTPQVVIVEN